MHFRTFFALMASVACLLVTILHWVNGFDSGSASLWLWSLVFGNIAWLALNLYGFASLREHLFAPNRTFIAIFCTIAFMLLVVMQIITFGAISNNITDDMAG